MGLAQVFAEDRRKIILVVLDKSNHSANEDILKQVIDERGNQAFKDMIRADMEFLEEHALIRIEKLPKERGELWIAHVLPAGRDVARGRSHVGVSRHEPD